MKLKINDKALCNFCTREFATTTDICDSKYCEDAKEAYLDFCKEKGIEIVEDLSFINLTIDSEIYYLDTNSAVPKIITERIKSITKEAKRLIVNILFSKDSSRCHIYIPLNKITENQFDNHFLSKKDCKEKFEKICIQRIVDLSKAIGGL